MFATFKQHFSKAELVSIIQTFLAFLAVDAAAQFQAVVSGDFSKPALGALAVAIGRSVIKVIWSMITSKPTSPQAPTA